MSQTHQRERKKGWWLVAKEPAAFFVLVSLLTSKNKKFTMAAMDVERLHVVLQQSFSPDANLRVPAEETIRNLKHVKGSTTLLLKIAAEKQVSIQSLSDRHPGPDDHWTFVAAILQQPFLDEFLEKSFWFSSDFLSFCLRSVYCRSSSKFDRQLPFN